MFDFIEDFLENNNLGIKKTVSFRINDKDNDFLELMNDFFNYYEKEVNNNDIKLNKSEFINLILNSSIKSFKNDIDNINENLFEKDTFSKETILKDFFLYYLQKKEMNKIDSINIIKYLSQKRKLSSILEYIKIGFRKKQELYLGIHKQLDKKYSSFPGIIIDNMNNLNNNNNIKITNPEKLLYPLLFNQIIERGHSITFCSDDCKNAERILNSLNYSLKVNDGIISIDDKGDQFDYENFYNTVVENGREDDFYVLNFNLPELSNKINIFKNKNIDYLINLITTQFRIQSGNEWLVGNSIFLFRILLEIFLELDNKNLIYTITNKNFKNISFKLLNEYLDINKLKELDIKLNNFNDIDTKKLKKYLTNLNDKKDYHEKIKIYIEEYLYIFIKYENSIFSNSNNAIDFIDIIKNKKIIYILLPGLKSTCREVEDLKYFLLQLIKLSICENQNLKIDNNDKRNIKIFLNNNLPIGFEKTLSQFRSFNVKVDYYCNNLNQYENNIDLERLIQNFEIKYVFRIYDSKISKYLKETFFKNENINFENIPLDFSYVIQNNNILPLYNNFYKSKNYFDYKITERLNPQIITLNKNINKFFKIYTQLDFTTKTNNDFINIFPNENKSNFFDFFNKNKKINDMEKRIQIVNQIDKKYYNLILNKDYTPIKYKSILNKDNQKECLEKCYENSLLNIKNYKNNDEFLSPIISLNKKVEKLSEFTFKGFKEIIYPILNLINKNIDINKYIGEEKLTIFNHKYNFQETFILAILKEIDKKDKIYINELYQLKNINPHFWYALYNLLKEDNIIHGNQILSIFITEKANY